MRPRTYSSKAFVLARKSHSEADRILTIYTRDYGKVVLNARGVRKPSSRKRGSIEIFSLIRFSASIGKGYDTLTETEIIDSYNSLRKDLKKVAVAYFFVETVDKLTNQEEPNSQVFDLLEHTFNDLAQTSTIKKSRLLFVESILVLLGYWPKYKKMIDHDSILESVVERELKTRRVGKILQY